MAGGLTPFAERGKIKILRRENGVERVIPFNYKQVEKGHGSSRIFSCVPATLSWCLERPRVSLGSVVGCGR